MTVDDANEAASILAVMLTALLATLTGGPTVSGAEFRYAVSDLRVGGLAQIQAGTLGLPLLNCFMLATASGATLAGMDAVRAAMTAETPAGVPGQAIANAGIRMALGQEARILAATAFTSSTAVLAALSAITEAFEAAEEYAADNRDPASYQALIGMQAAVVRDLTTRACVLPKIVTYAFPIGMTSHALANRLYGDASRCDELRAENGVIAPAFMPAAGTCLSE